MNNNFSFNYNKDLGETKVYVEQMEENPNNNDYNNYNNKQTNKYKIIGILLGGFLVFLVLFIILGLSIRNNIDKIDFGNDKDTTIKGAFPKPMTIISKSGKEVGCIRGYVTEDVVVEKLKEFGIIKKTK